MQFDLVILTAPLAAVAPPGVEAVLVQPFTVNLSVYRSVSRHKCFQTPAIIKNEGATSLSLFFSAPLCLFSVAGVQKSIVSYFRTPSLSHGPWSLQFFLCLEQGLLTHCAELDGWIDWSQRFWQRTTHPRRRRSVIRGREVISAQRAPLLSDPEILHSSCTVYLKTKQKQMVILCIFSLVQMFCNKTMMKHRRV